MLLVLVSVDLEFTLEVLVIRDFTFRFISSLYMMENDNQWQLVGFGHEKFQVKKKAS